MCARSSERPHRLPGPRPRGFTMVELVAVLLMAGVLAAVALPKLDGAFALRSDTARDEAVAALRYAAQTAQSHRRLVCVTVGGSAIALAIATSRGAGSCDAALAGPDGSTPYTANPGGAAFTLTPAGTLYFQPDGRATSDAAGANASTRTLGIAGAASAITILGESGLVQ